MAAKTYGGKDAAAGEPVPYPVRRPLRVPQPRRVTATPAGGVPRRRAPLVPTDSGRELLAEMADARPTHRLHARSRLASAGYRYPVIVTEAELPHALSVLYSALSEAIELYP